MVFHAAHLLGNSETKQRLWWTHTPYITIRRLDAPIRRHWRREASLIRRPEAAHWVVTAARISTVLFWQLPVVENDQAFALR
jgi:hypothetical protein